MDVVCDECGATNRSTDDFCTTCSAYLAWNDGGVPRAAAPAQPAAPERRGQPAPGSAPPGPRPAAASSTLITPLPDFGAAGTPAGPVPLGAGQTACPSCRTPNGASRRFCARCGYQLRASAPAAPAAPVTAEPEGWWARLWDPEDRAARRAYRATLPNRYRWRRAVAVVVLAGLVGTLLMATDGHPVARSVDQWWSIRNRHRLITVPDVQVTVAPADATTSSKPEALVDSSRDGWTTRWPGTTGTSCKRAPASPLVTLSFAPTRVRQLDVYAGLSPSLGDPGVQYRPKILVVRFDGGSCTELRLAQDYANLGLVADSGREVTKMTVGVREAYPPSQPVRTGTLSFGEIELKTRPRR